MNYCPVNFSLVFVTDRQTDRQKVMLGYCDQNIFGSLFDGVFLSLLTFQLLLSWLLSQLVWMNLYLIDRRFLTKAQKWSNTKKVFFFEKGNSVYS